MRELEPPEHHHLSAATGWLELGNVAEARSELARLAPASQDHPDVLELRWRIHAEEKDWPAAVTVARKLIEVDPENPGGWINQSYGLHELRRTPEAWERLLAVADKFANVSTIPYNLACYACQMGNLPAARHWLAKAVQARGKAEVKQMALVDPDLQPLREEIKRW